MSNNLPNKNAKYSHRITLDQAERGKTYEILACHCKSDVALRLAEMGLVPNTAVTVMKVAPLGDPLEITLRGYSLCIRASEAQMFSVRAT